MPPRRRSSSRRAGGSRPRYQQLNNVISAETSISAGGQALVDLLTGIPDADRLGLSCVRMRFRVSVMASTPGQSVEWALGILPITTDAFLAGAVPEPESDLNSWYLNDADVFSEAAGSGSQWRVYNYDVKTGRRLGAGIDLAFIMGNVSGSIEFKYTYRSSLFLRLP